MLYWASKAHDGDPDPGTSPQAVAAALASEGQVSAQRWPYEIGRDDAAPAPATPDEAKDPTQARRATVRELPCDANRIQAALSAGQLVVLGLDLWPGFYAPAAGWLEAPAPTDLLGDGHAVAVVGFDDSERSLLLRNSWGSTWGSQGHARLSLDALRVAGLGAWTVEDDVDALM